jgi:hypothetical protein
MLRTKTAFGAYALEDEVAVPWQAGESTTAVFWCLATMDTCGPDDGYVHPRQCEASRSCYRPPTAP